MGKCAFLWHSRVTHGTLLICIDLFLLGQQWIRSNGHVTCCFWGDSWVRHIWIVFRRFDHCRVANSGSIRSVRQSWLIRRNAEDTDRETVRTNSRIGSRRELQLPNQSGIQTNRSTWQKTMLNKSPVCLYVFHPSLVFASHNQIFS